MVVRTPSRVIVTSMVYVERVRLLPRTSIVVSILSIRTLIGVMSSLLPLVASNVA